MKLAMLFKDGINSAVAGIRDIIGGPVICKFYDLMNINISFLLKGVVQTVYIARPFFLY